MVSWPLHNVEFYRSFLLLYVNVSKDKLDRMAKGKFLLKNGRESNER